MGDLKNAIIMPVLFVAILSGYFFAYGGWFERTGSTAQVDPGGTFNTSYFSSTNNYMSSWANNTSNSISRAKSIPLIGIVFVPILVVYEGVILISTMGNDIILPLSQAVLGFLGLPPWFTSTAFIFILVSIIFGLVKLFSGGGS